MRAVQRVFLASCIALALALPAGASAQFPFTEKVAPSDIGTTGNFKFIAPTPGATGFGVYLGPYTAQMTSYPGSPLITIYCVDFLHDINYNQTWTANISRLDLADMPDTRLGIAGDDALALARYKRATWLAAQFVTNQTLTSWRQIHSAIWTIALAGNDPTMPYYNQYGDWIKKVNEAEASNFRGFNFREWALLTDVKAFDNNPYNNAPRNQPGTQEFLIRTTVTPEPETVVMLSTGLLMLGFAYWRRRRLA